MAKLTLSDITSGYSTPAKLNANNALIEAAFERCVFRDGTAPNTMLASLDMNSQRIINLPSPIDGNDAARYSDVLSLVNLDTAVPSQASNSGKVLSTNGTNLAWSFNGDDSAPLYYKRTAAEVTAGVTPTNFVYPTGDVRRYGATGDGTTDDTAALQNCAAVARAAVGLTIVFEPNKTYKIWPAGTGSTLFDLTGCNGVTVEMNGALLSAGSISGTILRVFDLNAVTNVTFRNVRYTQSYSTLDVANGGGLFVISNGSRRISFENVYQLNGLYGIVVLGEFASGGARSSQITAMNCEFENVYYPQSFQASGDNYFARNIRTIKCGRGYFPYNLRQHDVEMYSQHAGPFDDVLLTVYANPSSYNRLEQIKLRYYSDGRHASGTNQSADNAIIAFAAIQNTGTSTAAFFNDIDINVDFTPSVTPTTRKLLNFRKLTSAGAADTTARGHQFYNITIGGRVLSWADSASTQCLDFFDIDAGYNWSGDSAWNIAIKNFYATGGGSDVAIRLNGVPFAAGQGVILENVRTDMLFARSSWDEQKAFDATNFVSGSFSAVASYQTYSPSWTSTGTQPVIGNGTITGYYTRRGDRVKGVVTIAMGSTTTYGTGEYSFSLPTAAASGEGNHLGSVRLVDAGTAHYGGTSFISTAATTVQAYTHNAATQVAATVPFTFANGDVIVVEFDYIAAP